MSATPGKSSKPSASRKVRATPPASAEGARGILDALRAHIAVIDQTGKVLTTNAAWRQFAGENGGRGFSHTGVGENYLAGCRKNGEQSAKAALAGIESVLQGKLPIFNLEFACHSPSEPRWFRMSVTPLAAESGGAVISQEAIAPRLSLDGSAAGQPVVFGSDADSIWLVNVEDGEVFRFESVNDTFLHVTGFTRDQVLHRRLEEWFPPGSLGLVQAKYREVVMTGRTLHYEETSDLPAGRRVAEISVTPIMDAAGLCTMLLGTARDITARRQAEDALRASEERFALAVAGTEEGLWDWDLTTDAVFYAPRFKELLGYAPDDQRFPDAITSFRSHLHPEDVGPTEEAIRRAVQDGEPYRATYRLKTTGGEWRWFEARGATLRGAQGVATRMAGSITDITARRQIEEAQRESEERFRQVTETIDQVFWMTSVDKRRMLYVSPGYERIWGRTCQSLYAAPLTWLDSVHPEDRQSLLDAATSQQATGTYDVDYRIRRPDGTERWIHDRAFPIRNAAGEVERIAGVAEDITRRKQAEEALRESKALLAHAQELAQMGSYQFDVPFGTMSHWSAEIFRILGLDPARGSLPPADYIAEVIHPDDRQRVAKGVEKAARTGQRYDANYRIVRSDGEIRHVQSVAEPVLEADGQVRKFIGFIQDVTELRQLEAELLDISDHEQQRIGQDLHDDLCQQLVGLEFRLEALQHELPEPSQAHTELKQIGSLLRRATRHARTMAGVLSPVPPDPHGLMDALQSLVSNSALLFRIECEYQCETPVLVADHSVAAHLYRIAQEAISNAFKHGHATRVLVTLADSVGEGHLTIEDNGSGCPLPIPPGQGMGTRIMQYRAGMIGATLRLEPAASGGLIVMCSFQLRTP